MKRNMSAGNDRVMQVVVQSDLLSVMLTAVPSCILLAWLAAPTEKQSWEKVFTQSHNFSAQDLANKKVGYNKF